MSSHSFRCMRLIFKKNITINTVIMQNAEAEAFTNSTLIFKVME